jgi:hypothetical protein
MAVAVFTLVSLNAVTMDAMYLSVQLRGSCRSELFYRPAIKIMTFLFNDKGSTISDLGG